MVLRLFVVLSIEHRRLQHVLSNVASQAHLVVATAAALVGSIRIHGAAGVAVLWWMCACVRVICRFSWTTVFHAVCNMSLHAYAEMAMLVYQATARGWQTCRKLH